MELFDETREPLRQVWEDKVHRQQAKIVITNAIGNATDLSVREAQDVCDELDRLLEKELQEAPKQVNPGL